MPRWPPSMHVAGIDVLVAGAKLDPKWRDLTLEVRVRDSLALPDSALVRLGDPKGENIDSHPLQLGKDIEIKAGATGDRSTTSIFKGQIVALEPEFSSEGAVIVARALDKGHKLQRAAQGADLPADVGLGHGQQDRRRGRPDARRWRARASSTSSSSRARRPTGSSSPASRACTTTASTSTTTRSTSSAAKAEGARDQR